jgi:hypothetical protein
MFCIAHDNRRVLDAGAGMIDDSIEEYFRAIGASTRVMDLALADQSSPHLPLNVEPTSVDVRLSPVAPIVPSMVEPLSPPGATLVPSLVHSGRVVFFRERGFDDD